ncbi:hypothetical protein XENOCAPTIV_014732, partial [Xenoophorus captivus]
KLRQGGGRGLRLHLFSGDKCDCAEVRAEVSGGESVPARSLKRDRDAMTVGLLLAEYARTPSNTSSTTMTEAHHCITSKWPEPS